MLNNPVNIIPSILSSFVITIISVCRKIEVIIIVLKQAQ